MPRPKRIHYEGAVYHVTSRGNERRKIVMNDDDRRQFLRILEEVIEEEQVLCHAWVLMDNHYHLMLETPAGNLSAAMKHLNGVYTQKFNKKHRRAGHLFQGRFKTIVVEKNAYLKELCRYLVLNPVRAKRVKTPQAWKWSSYRATGGLTKAEKWMETGWILAQFGKSEKQAQKAYRAFVEEGQSKKSSPWENLYSRIYLGTDVFLKKARRIRQKNKSLDVQRYQKNVVRANPAKVLEKVGKVYGEKLSEILRPGRKEHEARQAAIYWLRRESGLSLKEIGKRMGISFSAVGNQWTKVKKRIEKDAEFEKRLLKCRM